ncbi:hypothetical protein [Methylomonas methanica]|uniref:hypothetical protein n=1 Tax=Methylomonas methanica TaxID=421 RepID=UPI00059E1AE9|nr:hypothetical protein [Methylomonas methanica]
MAKRKYPKKTPPHAAFILRAEGFERGFPKGLPSPYEKRDASLHRPYGLIRPNPPVLGAASGDFFPLRVKRCGRSRPYFAAATAAYFFLVPMRCVGTLSLSALRLISPRGESELPRNAG